MSHPDNDAALEAAERVKRGQRGVFATLTPAVRRLAAMHLHYYFIVEDASYFEYFGPLLQELESLEVPWHRDDLAWALGNLECVGSPSSDAPYWVPGLIAVALDPAELGEALVSLQEAFDGMHEHRLPTGAFRELIRLWGTALSMGGRHIPADLMLALRHLDVAAPDLKTALADTSTQALLRHAAALTRPAPSKAWLRTADDLLATSPRVADAVALFLRSYLTSSLSSHGYIDELLRGLAWAQSRSPGSTLLSDLAVVAGSPRWRGAAEMVAPKAAVALVDILAERPGDEPVRALARLSLTTRSKTLLPRVVKALDRIGEARGWAPGEALELSVDDHGLDASGSREFPLSEHPGGSGVVTIVDGKARLRAARDGTPLRSVPAAWKDDLAEARAVVSAINKTLGIERGRVEDLLSQDRIWTWATWVQRYLDHPITSGYAQRLIWQVSSDGESWTTGIPRRDDAGWTLSDPDSGAEDPSSAAPSAPAPSPSAPSASAPSPSATSSWRVRLWHPALADAAEVARWRDRIVAAEVRQPFKQAFREIYPLTPAEVETGTYSNRFAAHILRYPQAYALMRERGWSSNYLGGWDGGYHGEATKEFGAGQWRVSFFHDLVESEGWRSEYCATDQVRFARRDGRAWAVTPLTEVPPLVFTEAMRDVDLFVGVTSLATDDSWQDRGQDRFHDYWRQVAFGGLGPAGDVRRDVLARLLPRLAIGPRCRLEERYLRVEGTLGAYRIHLGSGNILMEPDDAYLCVVPDRRPGKKVRLPFDDDAMLSTILSKAILLAADDRITDESIRHQLLRSRL